MEGGETGDDGNALNDALFAQQYAEGGENVDDSGEDGERGDSEPLREQDRFLPIANVARIMKKSIPKNGKIAKEAKDCVQECVSEFVSFITSEASERCQMEKRKTINGEDILFAMATLGFDNFVEPLKVYLQKFRESTKGGEKSITSQVDENMVDLGATGAVDESYAAISSSILTAGGDQPHIIYTTSFNPSQLSQQLNFG